MNPFLSVIASPNLSLIDKVFVKFEIKRLPAYVTIGKPAFCLNLYLTGVHFRGELQHVGHVGEQKIKC